MSKYEKPNAISNVFNVSNFTHNGSNINHNDLKNINQSPYYHLNAVQYNKATNYSSTIQDGILSASDYNAFKTAANSIPQSIQYYGLLNNTTPITIGNLKLTLISTGGFSLGALNTNTNITSFLQIWTSGYFNWSTTAALNTTSSTFTTSTYINPSYPPSSITGFILDDINKSMYKIDYVQSLTYTSILNVITKTTSTVYNVAINIQKIF